MICRHAIVCALAVLICAVASADLCPVSYSGGTLTPLEDHPSIAMTDELLVIDPFGPGAEVRAAMTFSNGGEACRVLMGFPICAHSVDGGYYPVEGVSMAVDGGPVPLQETTAPLTLNGKELKSRWYTLSVYFAAGQQRCLEARYRMSPPAPRLRVPYILQTGSRWHGGIGSLRVEVLGDDVRNLGGFTFEADGKPLPWSEENGRAVWAATNYDGKPEVLWAKGELGPYVVGITGPHDLTPDADTARWHADKLLLHAEMLSDLLMLQTVEVVGGEARLSKEGRSVLVACQELRSLVAEGSVLFVDPEPAFAAWGGGGEVVPKGGVDGLEALHLTAPFSDEAAVRQTALWPDQVPEYRLRCLKYLGEKAADACAEVCAEIAARDTDEPQVQRWAAAYTVGLAPEGAQVASVAAKLQQGSEQPMVPALAGLVLATSDDTVLRGAAALMAHVDADQGARQLLDRFPVYNPWYHGSRQARNAGLALRAMGLNAYGTLAAIVAANEGEQTAEDAMVAMGMACGDEAIGLLSAQALDAAAITDIRCAGARGLALIGSPEALRACARVARECDDRHVYGYAIRGLQFAFDPGYRSVYDPHPAPDWARGTTREEARQIVAPLLVELAACARDEREQKSVAYVQRVMDGLRAAR